MTLEKVTKLALLELKEGDTHATITESDISNVTPDTYEVDELRADIAEQNNILKLLASQNDLLLKKFDSFQEQYSEMQKEYQSEREALKLEIKSLEDKIEDQNISEAEKMSFFSRLFKRKQLFIWGIKNEKNT